MLSRAFRLTIVIGVLITGILFVPTKDGLLLLTSIFDVQKLSSAYRQGHSGTSISFEPSRYSPVEIFSHDLALSTAEKTTSPGNNFLLRGRHASILAQSVSFPASNECIVHASAQTFSQRSGAYAALKSSIPDDGVRWSYVLLHEQAHCLWNPTLIAENYLLLNRKNVDIYSARPYFLSQYLGEAYADAYALSILLIEKPEQSRGLSDAVGNWRAATTTQKMHHRTIATIAFTQDEISKRNLEIKNFQQMHAFVLKMAMRGMYYWLLDQGVSTDDASNEVQLMQDIMKTRYALSELTKAL
jgi:hypothetical protein